MTVADKFKPVSTETRRTDPVRPVLFGALVLAAALWLWSARDVATQVAQDAELVQVPGLAAVTDAVAQLADGLGLTTLRAGVDRLAAPLHDSPRIGAAPEPEPELAPKVMAPPPEPEAPPGVRWVGPHEGAPHVERLLLVGASSIQYALGTELERYLEASFDVEVKRHGKLGTGLTRDDVYDWLGVIAEQQAAFHPQVVVAQFGGNDCQPIVYEGERHAFGTEGWDTAFSARLTRLAAQVQADGAELLFLGMPPMREPGFDGRIERYNRVARAAVEAAGGSWVDVRDLAGDADGNYRVSGPVGGRTVRLRMSDGIHFTRRGAEALAPALARRLEQRLSLVPVDQARALAIPGALTSAARGGEETRYLAFVPREVPDEGLPGVLLLHGAWGSWTDWSEHDHDELARLSAELGLVLVLPDGRPFGWYLDSPLQPDSQLQRYFVAELIPTLTERLPVRGWSATGLSMGGHGALTLALEHPGLLDSVTTLSAVPDLSKKAGDAQLEALLGPYEADPARWQAHSAAHLLAEHPWGDTPLLVACGQQDKWWGANQALHEQLEAAGVSHTFEGSPGGHDWTWWTGQLPRHLAFHVEALGPEPDEVSAGTGD